MRLDKFLSELNIGTRSQVKNPIRRGEVTVNGRIVTSPEYKIDEAADRVVFRGRELTYRRFLYYMMNKPAGVVSAAEDGRFRTVLDLLEPYLREEDRKKGLFPVGRLDKDTEGLLLLTNDGALAHELLSPAKHVAKTYLAHLREPLSGDAAAALERGVDIGEKRPTLPAEVEYLEDVPCRIRLTIHEGKFHQVKRMLQAVGNEVLSLKRVAFGGLTLDERLQPGQCRELTGAEVELLCSRRDERRAGAELLYPRRDERRAGAELLYPRRDERGAGAELLYPRRDERGASVKPPVMDGVEAVIFDLDGTLADSMWMWREIDIEYLGRFGIPLPEDLQSCIEGMSFHETAVYFKEHFPIPDSLEQIKNDWNAMAWDKYAYEVPLKPGAGDFLRECRRRGIRLGIATSNSRELVANIAETHGLHDYFECIVTGSDVERGKPFPDIYLSVAGQLGVEPENCLVFEDIIPGIQAGQAAGMRVCAVEDAYSADVRYEKQMLADYYIADYTEICF